MKGDQLSPKMEAFCQEYANDPERNATEAYLRAGYKTTRSAARRSAATLLTKPDIKDRIAELLKPVVDKWEVTRERVIGELAKVAFANIGDMVHVTSAGDPYIDLSRLDRDGFAALTEVTVEDFMSGRGDDAREVRRVKVKMADKLRSLELLGKTLAMFTDKVEVNVRTDTAERLALAKARALERMRSEPLLVGSSSTAKPEKAG